MCHCHTYNIHIYTIYRQNTRHLNIHTTHAHMSSTCTLYTHHCPHTFTIHSYKPSLTYIHTYYLYTYTTKQYTTHVHRSTHLLNMCTYTFYTPHIYINFLKVYNHTYAHRSTYLLHEYTYALHIPHINTNHLNIYNYTHIIFQYMP